MFLNISAKILAEFGEIPTQRLLTAQAGTLLLAERPVLAREDAFDVGEAGVALAALAANDAATAALLKKLHPEGEDLNAPRLAEVWRHNGFESGL